MESIRPPSNCTAGGRLQDLGRKSGSALVNATEAQFLKVRTTSRAAAASRVVKREGLRKGGQSFEVCVLI